MFCVNCGKKLPDDSKFCLHCGKKVVRLSDNKLFEDESSRKKAQEETPVCKKGDTIKHTNAEIRPYCHSETEQKAVRIIDSGNENRWEDEYSVDSKHKHVENVKNTKKFDNGKYESSASRIIMDVVCTIVVVVIIATVLNVSIILIDSIRTKVPKIVAMSGTKEAYSHAKEAITNELLAPATAEFPKYNESYVIYSGTEIANNIKYDMYTVTSYVDSSNALGVMVRTKYKVKIGLPTDSNVDKYYYDFIYIE